MSIPEDINSAIGRPTNVVRNGEVQGRLIAYLDQPSVTIELPSGERQHHALSVFRRDWTIDPAPSPLAVGLVEEAIQRNKLGGAMMIDEIRRAMLEAVMAAETRGPRNAFEAAIQEGNLDEQMSILSLIDELDKLPDRASVRLYMPAVEYGDGEAMRLAYWDGTFGSYRGYYAQLYIGFTDEPNGATVRELRVSLDGAIESEYESWKSGPYTMHASTELWIDSLGESRGIAVHGVAMIGDEAVVLGFANPGW